ncbi:MAG: metallophosphoesterase family protein [Candidatus Izemoplasmatales bacterium]
MKRCVMFLSIAMFAFATAACGAATLTTSTTSLPTTIADTTEPTTVASTSTLDLVMAISNPFYVALYMNEHPDRYVNVNFVLSADTGGVAEWRVASDPEVVETASAILKTMMVGRRTVHAYAATIGPLVPGVTYEYRVKSADGTESDEWRTYRCPASDITEFAFAFMADPQENDQIGYMAFAHAFLSVRAEAGVDVDFGLFVGDVVNDHDDRTQWQSFLRYASVFAVGKPIATTIGNHEHGAISEDRMAFMEYDGYTHLPTNGPTYGAFVELADDRRPANVDRGKTYSFDYGGVHFVALDTEIFCDGTTACLDRDEANVGILLDWLETDLAAAGTDRIIVFMHRGPYSATYDTTAVREALPAIFEEYGVDLVLSGHDHQYSRSVYSGGAAVLFGRADDYPLGTVSLLGPGDGADFNDYSSSIGPTYLVGNTAGTKFYDAGDASGIFLQFVYAGNNPVIPIVTVKSDSIEVVSYVLYKNNPTDIVPSGVGILERFTIR